RVHSIRFPRRVVVICNNRITNTQRRYLPTNVRNLILVVQLRRMHAYNRDSFGGVLLVPTLNEGQCVSAVVTAECPKLYDYDLTLKVLDRQRLRVDPSARGELRCKVSVSRRFDLGG